MDRFVDIQLWDLVPHTESIFLGETNVDLQKAFLDDRAIWYRLEDPRGMRSGSMNRSPSVSPRGSISVEHNRYRRNDYLQRSISDDVDSIGDGTSLLHPDHAWVAGSRRGSSQSETLEVEVYQLGKDFSRSLPGSRRSSFQDREQQESKDGEATPPPTIYLNNRRRSSCVRRDPDEILKSLKAVKGELGRTMSLSAAEKRPTSRRKSTNLFVLNSFIHIYRLIDSTLSNSDMNHKLMFNVTHCCILLLFYHFHLKYSSKHGTQQWTSHDPIVDSACFFH